MEQGRSEAGLVELKAQQASTHPWGLLLRLKVWQLPAAALPVSILRVAPDLIFCCTGSPIICGN